MEISNSGPKSYETATVMKMPASFAEFSDALQKARIKDGSFCKNELTCIHYNGLTHAMIGWNANLYDLNLFAQRLASLTEEQKKGMDALLKIKQNHRVAPIPLNQLINLTYNTDICCFAPRVSNHEELGAFLYANEMLSNEAMALLDTTEEGSGFQERLLELLGEQHQEDHGGVFTDFGYAELGGEIKDIYVCQSNETACFHRSDAPVMLEVRKGFFNDPSYDNDKTAVLNLPAADAGIWRAVEKVDAASVDECAFRCVDCLIPFLRDAINNANHRHYQYALAGLTPSEYYTYVTTGIYPVDNYYGIKATELMPIQALIAARRRAAEEKAKKYREASAKKRAMAQGKKKDPEFVIARDQRILRREIAKWTRSKELALQQISHLREILELSQKARAYLMTASADLILQLYNGENWGAHPELAYIYKMRELF